MRDLVNIMSVETGLVFRLRVLLVREEVETGKGSVLTRRMDEAIEITCLVASHLIIYSQSLTYRVEPFLLKCAQTCSILLIKVQRPVATIQLKWGQERHPNALTGQTLTLTA